MRRLPGRVRRIEEECRQTEHQPWIWFSTGETEEAKVDAFVWKTLEERGLPEDTNRVIWRVVDPKGEIDPPVLEVIRGC